jgi:serine/threonine-protein kinase
MSPEPIARERVQHHLERVLSSAAFRGAERSRALLRFLVDETLDGRGERLKEYTVGAEALGRGVAFDPRTDPIVRAEVSRLRSRLDRYYASTDGQSDDVVIELPKGTYVPAFSQRNADNHAIDPGDVRKTGSARRTVAWVIVGSLTTVAAFAIGAWIARPGPSDDRPAFVLDVQLQSIGTVGSEVGTDVVIAPDGSRAVFVSTDSAGVSRLRVRRFDGSPPTDLPSTDGARGPFLSPDGRWVGFWSGGRLKKTSLDGGSPVVLCAATDLLGASWSGDGRTIIAALDATGRLFRVPADGGSPMVAVDPETPGTSALWPQLLPDGKHVLFTATTGLGADRANIEFVSLADRRRTVLIKGGTFARYVPPGYLTYVNQGTMYAVRFDVDRAALRGSPVPIVDDVAYSPTFGYAQLDIASSGVMAYRRAAGHGRMIAALLDSSGHSTPMIDTPGRYVWPAVSPDGRRLALTVTESGVSSVSIFANSNDRFRRVFSAAGLGAPAWTRDGRFVVVQAQAGAGLAVIRVDGGQVTPLLAIKSIAVPWTFTPDGRRLAYYAMSPATAFDLWSVPIETRDSTLRAGTPQPILQTPSFEVYPAFSPDGRWLAYTSNESGTWEVYVRSVSGSANPVQVSRRGGRVPRWSNSGDKLFYSTDDQRLMVVSFSVTPRGVAPRQPRLWTSVRLADTGVLPSFDVSPDGNHIVALLPAARPEELPGENHVALMFDISDVLRRRVP